jgi:hypothetical protein
MRQIVYDYQSRSIPLDVFVLDMVRFVNASHLILGSNVVTDFSFSFLQDWHKKNNWYFFPAPLLSRT